MTTPHRPGRHERARVETTEPTMPMQAHYYDPADAPREEITTHQVLADAAIANLVQAPFGSERRRAWHEIALKHHTIDGRYRMAARATDGGAL